MLGLPKPIMACLTHPSLLHLLPKVPLYREYISFSLNSGSAEEPYLSPILLVWFGLLILEWTRQTRSTLFCRNSRPLWVQCFSHLHTAIIPPPPFLVGLQPLCWNLTKALQPRLLGAKSVWLFKQLLQWILWSKLFLQYGTYAQVHLKLNLNCLDNDCPKLVHNLENFSPSEGPIWTGICGAKSMEEPYTSFRRNFLFFLYQR